MTKNTFKKLALAAATATAFGANVHAQSADAIIDKLVEKGILTVKEAQDLRDEADKNFTTALSSKTGMADWVQALKFNGDVRGRYEKFDGHDGAFVERSRFRYRVRFGVVATLNDNFEAGFKLTTSEPAAGGGYTGTGGDPISGNSTMQNNGEKKMIYMDQAYGKWTPFKGPSLTGGFTVGKMANPFVIDDMVFDPDYTPEGVAAQLAYQFNDKHSLKVNGGWFVLDEIAGSGQDPYLFGGQIRWDALWKAKFNTSLGFTALALESKNNLGNSAVPNMNVGNTRTGAGGTLVYNYNPLIVDAAATYLLDSAPYYTGAFPIKLTAEYMNNPGAPSGAGNQAYNFGVVFGKAGKRHTWELSYTYKWLGANSQWEELTDSDFGAYYPDTVPAAGNVPPNSGLGVGYRSGTNVKGHVVKFAYSPSDSLTLSVKWFMTSLVDEGLYTAVGNNTDMSRMQVDALWTF